jgi:hypothetical protein
MKTKMFIYGSSTFKVSQFNLVRRNTSQFLMQVPACVTGICHNMQTEVTGK